LKLLRIHTFSLTGPAIIIGYILQGNVNLYYAIAILIYALLFHAFGFLWNNIFDLKYDKLDPAKKHFPLVSGEITLSQARTVAIVGTALTFVYGLFLFSNNIFSFVFFIFAIVFGFAYNITNKIFEHAHIFIALSFSSLVISPFLEFHSFNYVILAYFVFSFFTMMFQNQVSGNIKDLEVPQKNLLKNLGCRLIDNDMHITKAVLLYALGLRFVVLFSGIVFSILLYKDMPLVITLIVFEIVQVIVFKYTIDLLRPGKFDRDKRVQIMSLVEITNYYSLVVIVTIYAGLYVDLFLYLFPILYFIIMNKITWGTVLGPKV